jgi:hypothetical protein
MAKKYDIVIGLPETAYNADTLKDWVAALATLGTSGYAYGSTVYRRDTGEPIPADYESLVVCGDPDIAVDLASRGYLVTPPMDGQCVCCGAVLVGHYSYRPVACDRCKRLAL